METPIRTLDISNVKQISEVFNSLYPMLPDFVPAMIKAGVYQVQDRHGNIVSAEKAVEIIKG